MLIKGKYKIARRLGPQIFEKTQTQKFAISTSKKGRKFEPKHIRQRTDYGNQMLEKQKARFMYIINERQFSKYVRESLAKKTTKASDELYRRLEMRLDNVVYRIGFANTRLFSRQMVTHGHIKVNGKKVSIPSYEVKNGDKISIRDRSLKKPIFTAIDEKLKNAIIPVWIKLDDKKVASIQGVPKINKNETSFNLQAIIEFYSR